MTACNVYLTNVSPGLKCSYFDKWFWGLWTFFFFYFLLQVTGKLSSREDPSPQRDGEGQHHRGNRSSMLQDIRRIYKLFLSLICLYYKTGGCRFPGWKRANWSVKQPFSEVASFKGHKPEQETRLKRWQNRWEETAIWIIDTNKQLEEL